MKFSFRRAKAIAIKEFRHIWRDTRSLGMALLIPLVLVFLFGHVLTLDVKDISTIVLDRSKTPESRRLISEFTGSSYFQVQQRTQDESTLTRALSSGRIRVGLVVPSDFQKKVATAAPTTLQVLVDATDANTANIIKGYVSQVAQRYRSNLMVESENRASGGGITRVQPVPRVWYNPNLKSKYFIIPGLIAVIMMIVGALLTSQTISREYETGTIETLISTPVKSLEVVSGKLFPYFVIGMVDVFIAVAFGHYWFGVPLVGSRALLAGTSAIFLVVAMCMGFLISVRTKSQLLSTQMALVMTFLPAFLLSGFVFPIQNMPGPIRLITYAVPARYFVVALKGIFLKGIGLEILWIQELLLIVFGFILVLMSIKSFRKTLG
jgi:ABC-2 type transport system permease protein